MVPMAEQESTDTAQTGARQRGPDPRHHHCTDHHPPRRVSLELVLDDSVSLERQDQRSRLN